MASECSWLIKVSKDMMTSEVALLKCHHVEHSFKEGI